MIDTASIIRWAAFGCVTLVVTPSLLWLIGSLCVRHVRTTYDGDDVQ